MRTKPTTLFTALAAATLLAGCQAFDYHRNYTYSYGTSEFRPSADGPAAVAGATAEIPGLHLAYAGRTTGVPGAFGPGLARLNGTVLEAFSMDGSLDPASTASSQPGFFWRPTATFGGYGTSINTSGDTDGVVAVGEWFARSDLQNHVPPYLALTRNNFVSDGTLAYAVGQLTPTAGLPQSGTARYSLSASTWHGYHVSASGALSVLWGGPASKVGLDLQLNDGLGSSIQLDYHILTTGGVANPAQSEISVRPGTATFAGSGVPVPICRDDTCQAEVEGFFAGNGGNHAGLVFRVTGTAISDQGVGAAAFAFSEFAVPPAPPPALGSVTLLDQTDPSAFAMAFAASGAGALPSSVAGPPATAIQAADGQLNSFSFTTGTPSLHVDVQRGTTSSPAAETGGDSLITWGRWTSGTRTGTTIGTSTPNANQGFHYVVGAATPPANIPTSGTATFNLMGATKPTFGDGAFAPGTFTGSMAVQWGGAAATKVGVDFTIAMAGDASYRLMSTGGVATPATSEISTSGGSSFTGQLSTNTGNITVTPTGGTGRACGAPCFANVSGFFAGQTATRAGVVYNIGTISTTAIQGAAAFSR
jgi:hypothetical protein